MAELVSLIAKFGWAVVLVAALVFIVLRGEIIFRYPRDPDDTRPAPPKPSPPRNRKSPDLD